MHFRCPNCLKQIEIAQAEQAKHEITCPSCQSRITLASDETRSIAPADLAQVSGYEVQEILGAGGFGTVYRAWDQSLEREVALKIPRDSRSSRNSGSAVLREARAAAAISHPNVVSIYEVGVYEESFYIASELINGASLANYLKTHQLPRRQAVEMMITLLRAAHCFHEKGIVHRDLKPSNILLDGELVPYISDFGLAHRDLPAEATVTESGKLIGTPAYMSPEQARGELSLVSIRSDVYAFGVIFYEMLTGLRPFKATDSQTLIHSILHDDPLPLRRIDRKIERDLETICLKAIEKESEKRYESAEAMASDLSNFLEGKTIQAKSPGVVPRTWKWVRRNKATSLSGFVVLVATLVLSLQFAFIARSDNSRPIVKHRVRIHCEVEDLSRAGDGVHWAFALLNELRMPVEESVQTMVGTADMEVELAPGEYLVVAAIPGYGFHEVYRRVPITRDESASGSLNPSQFGWDDDVVVLPAVFVVHEAVATRNMVRVEAGTLSTGTLGNPFTPPFTVSIDDFYIEPIEVTFDAYTQALPEPVIYSRLATLEKGQHPVVGVNWFLAAHYAEALNRRLVTEFEWEFVATNGSTTTFPWGDGDEQQPVWGLSNVSADTADVTRLGIKNLFSNSAELTSSVLAPYPGGEMLDNTAELAQFGYVYRGGPGELSELKEDGSWIGRVTRRMSSTSRDEGYSNVGFRCARSVKPRFVSWEN